MPTFREDLHLGHEVPMVETDDLIDGAITEQKMADNSVSARTIQPDAIDGSKIQSGSIENRHLVDNAVDTRTISNKSVSPEKLNDFVKPFITDDLDRKYGNVTRSLDEKYTNITNELYSMVASLQVGGIALSQKFGDREDIGISQKTLTKAVGAVIDILGSLTHHDYMDFTMTITPSIVIAEGERNVTVKADCTEAISDFDNIKVYRDDELVAESGDIRVYEISVPISETSVIKVVGTILGKAIIKQQTVSKLFPFFMGGGNTYQDVLVPECAKELVGTLEGEYDATVSTTGQYLFVIIPISRKEEFRRCKMDMNGFEIPFDITETSEFVVCRSLNVYQAGTYNIDININS